MSYAVQKSPIKVIEIKEGDNINNYSELTYRKLETVPVDVADKYLKWVGEVLAEMTAEEKAVVDGDALTIAKAAKIAKIRQEAENNVKMVFVGTGVTIERVIVHMWKTMRSLTGADQMNSELEIAFDQALIANTTAENAKLAAVEAATTVEALEAI